MLLTALRKRNAYAALNGIAPSWSLPPYNYRHYRCYRAATMQEITFLKTTIIEWSFLSIFHFQLPCTLLD